VVVKDIVRVAITVQDFSWYPDLRLEYSSFQSVFSIFLLAPSTRILQNTLLCPSQSPQPSCFHSFPGLAIASLQKRGWEITNNFVSHLRLISSPASSCPIYHHLPNPIPTPISELPPRPNILIIKLALTSISHLSPSASSPTLITPFLPFILPSAVQIFRNRPAPIPQSFFLFVICVIIGYVERKLSIQKGSRVESVK
jgi:hypothetical protein